MADQQPLRPFLRQPGQMERDVQGRQPQRGYPTQKLLLIAALGGMALLLGCMIVVVQIRVNYAHDRLLEQSKNLPGSGIGNSKGSGKGGSASGSARKSTVASEPTKPQHLHMSQQPQSLPDSGSSRMTAAVAYWNQFQGISPEEARPWSPLDEVSLDFRSNQDYDYFSPSSTGSGMSDHNLQNRSLAEAKYFALQRAAQLGHPQAQHIYANALASGVLPLPYDQSSHLEVADDFMLSHTRQQQEAWLNWHMAATSGHVEAAMALAHRYDTLHQQSTASLSPLSTPIGSKRKTAGAGLSPWETEKESSSSTRDIISGFQCADVLPYYAAAAHGIIDKLEANLHSRAKVLPPSEKHLLYQVHMHGGTSSQLDWHNKPDESMEALQFYHFKATRAVDPDPSAAITLATLYHFGYRGVVQNLTLALQYYDIAASAGSWEAAGMSGWFHVNGLGLHAHERDLHKAHKYFRKGIIGGLNDCQERFHKKRRFKQPDSVTQCEASCLNGMGLLHLYGVPLTVEVDLDEAIEYFTLAKDMGNADAAYNLAMVTLGWKSHYVPLDEALRNQKVAGENDDGVTKLDLPSFMEDPYRMKAGPSHTELKQVAQLLMTAMQKRHLQARHRLAMLFDSGVLSTPDDTSGVRRTKRQKNLPAADCDKALKHYKWIVDEASPEVSQRLRKAYKDYIAGDLESSLIQYMSIAELGNDVAQVNAAFLLEQGTCLGLSSTDCHKASVRYWKAASAAGNAEACLRVGDFYYYGKLRPPQDPFTDLWDKPFGWVDYLIFPEKYWIPVFSKIVQFITQEVVLTVYEYLDPSGSMMGSNSEDEEDTQEAADGSCVAKDGDEGTCAAPDAAEDTSTHHTKTQKEEQERDLKMAAHYYRIAAEKHASPRANFNLAFLHEWGLGLTQDFPLAKRHYDLAASAVAASREADLAVQIALWTLAFHEYVVRLRVALEEYTSGGPEGDSTPATSAIMDAVPKAINNMIGRPVPGGPTEEAYSFVQNETIRKTKVDVLLSHLWSWESLAILVLTVVLWHLIQRRRQRTRR